MEPGLIPFDVSTLKQIHLVYTSTLIQIHLLVYREFMFASSGPVCPRLDDTAGGRFVTNSPTNGSPVPRLIWVKQVDETCILILRITSPPNQQQCALDWTTHQEGRRGGLSQTVPPPKGHQSHA